MDDYHKNRTFVGTLTLNGLNTSFIIITNSVYVIRTVNNALHRFTTEIGMSTSRLSSYFKALSTTYHGKETKNKRWKLLT